MPEERVRVRRRIKRKKTLAEKILTRRNLLLGAGAAVALGAVGIVAVRMNRRESRNFPIQGPVKVTITEATTPDAHTSRQRMPPPRMPELPFLPVEVNGPGDVTLSNSLLAAFDARYPDVLNGARAYVAMDGDDTAAHVDDAARPFATLNAALKSEARVIVVKAGKYSPPDYRRSREGNPLPKLIMAEGDDEVILEIPGDDLTKAPWATDGGLWKTTLSAPTIGGALVHRMIRNDQQDRFGFPKRLRHRKSLSELRSTGEGWFVDTASRALYVGVSDWEAVRPNLRAYYIDAAENAHVRCDETVLCLHNIALHGLTVWAYHHEAGAPRPEIWLSHFTSLFSNHYGAVASVGGSILMESGRIHAPARDGHNVDWGDDSGLVVAAGLHLTSVGDVEGLGPPDVLNIQAGSSHGGFAAVFGCVVEGCQGQAYADTSTPSAPNIAWYVGNHVEDATMGFHSVGTGQIGSDNRVLYLDTNATRIEQSLALEARGRAYLFNNRFGGRTVLRDAVTLGPEEYQPAAPPLPQMRVDEL